MQNMIPNRKEKGFTLIELVMVIVILGILAAFALPRFADFGSDAREASLQGANGAVKSAAAIAHSRWVADGDDAGTVDLDGSPGITMSAGGYPTADGGGIGAAAQLSNEFTIESVDNSATDAANISIEGDGTCQFSYDPTTGSTTVDPNNDC